MGTRALHRSWRAKVVVVLLIVVLAVGMAGLALTPAVAAGGLPWGP